MSENHNNHISEETRSGLKLLLGLLLFILCMALLNFLMGKDTILPDKDKGKTVIVTESKQGETPRPPPPKSVVSTVQDAIKQGNYSTAYLEISKAPQGSPEYDELRKQLAQENKKQQKAGVRKEAGAAAGSPIRYFDESTPRNRSADGIYIYFVEISGTLWPRFCIQTVSKKPLGITGFIISADGKNVTIPAATINTEKTEKGTAEWYDMPLDRISYGAVQALLRAKKTTLTIKGKDRDITRNVSENEIKGFRRILDGYTALGGNLAFLQGSPASSKTRP